MKALLLIAALFFSISSWAATADCTAFGSPVQVTLTEVTPFSFKCSVKNMLNGTGTFPSFRATATGIAAWNYCSDDGFKPYTFQLGAATYEKLADTAFLADWALAMTATDSVKAMNDFMDKYATTPLEDPSLMPIWCPSMPEILAGKPPTAQFVVQPYTGYTTRATYPTTAPLGGTRSTVSNGRTPILVSGQPALCDCNAGRVIEGSALYCSVNSTPTTVAPCKAK